MLSTSQQQQVHTAIEESLKDKVEGLGRLKEGIQILHVEIEDKCMKKEELVKLYEEQKANIEY